MPSVYDLANQFRRDLLARDQQVINEMTRQYAGIYGRVKEQLAQAQAAIDALPADATAAEKKAVYAWRQRYRELQKQAAAELAQFARDADAAIRQAQYAAVSDAQEQARLLTLAALGPAKDPIAAAVAVQWSYLPADAVTKLVGFAGDGGPLHKVLVSLAAGQAQGVKDLLVQGLALGQNPRQTARQIARHLGGGLVRAMTIARTETLRAYREASIEGYRANDDVVKAWRWQASHSLRTCGACLAMDGRVFPLSTPFGSHPNCRCVPVPETVSWADLGVEGAPEPSEPRTGEEWLKAQSPERQDAVLGPGKAEAWRQGQFELRDLVGYRDDPQWGPVRWERPLKDVVSE